MRIVSGMMLAVAVGLAIGCSGSKPTQAEPNVPLNGEPPPGPPPSAPKDPPDAKVGWEMDPAKQVIPAIPVAGVVAGQAFTPDVSLFDRTLTFRVQREGQGQRVVEVAMTPELWNDPATMGVVISPDRKEGWDVPRVMLGVEPPGPSDKTGSLKMTAYPNGYAMKLEIKRQEKNRYAGRIALSLPDEAKSFIAGEFTVTRIRPADSPPGPDDSPFVQGKLTVTGADDPVVETGYVGVAPGGQFVQGQLDFPFSAKDQFTYAEFGESKDGRVTSIAAPKAAAPKDSAPFGRYEHTRLPPTRYLIYARVVGGPVACKWVTVEANSQLAADFAIDAAKSGGLEVTLPAGFAGDVRLAPADDPAKPLDAGLFLACAVVLKLEAKPKDGKAAFAKLGPGTYEVRAGDLGELTGIVEVKPGETAKIELKKK